MISGYRSLDYSGCLLAYAYFKGIAISDIKSRLDNGDIPIAVKYINDYDLWKFNEGDNTDAFCTAADALMTGPEDSRFNTFINSPDIDYRTKLLDEFLLKGQALILASKQRVHKIADRQTKFNVKTAKGVAISVSFINSTSDISRLGSHINKELGCDIAAIYEVITEEVNDVKTGEKKIIDKIVVHLRSRTCDVEVLARIFKGGGHVGAASYKMNGAVANVRDMLFARIYNSYERV